MAGVQLDGKDCMVHSPWRMQTEHKAIFLLVLGGFHLVYAACYTDKCLLFSIKTSSCLVLFYS